jgi:hypothetical protein
MVTRLSQLGAHLGSRLGTARDGFGWSADFESHCRTMNFSRCPTGAQVVAGSSISWHTAEAAAACGEEFLTVIERRRIGELRSTRR